MFNLVILIVYILNKHYGCEKLSHDEYRDKIVKYRSEGLKNYNIPLPPVIVGELGNIIKVNMTRNDHVNGIFLLTSPGGGQKKGETFKVLFHL